MRAIHLIKGEIVGVDAEFADVRQAVRREGDAVDEGQGAGAVGEVGELAHRVDAADDVRAVRERDELRSRAEQRLEVAALELRCLGIDLPFAHHDAVVREAGIGPDVRLVVLVGDDDLVAGLQAPPQRLRQHERVLRGRGPEVELVRADIEPGGQARLRGVHLLAGAGRGGERVVGLDLGLPVVALEPGDRLAGRVGTARILEMGEPGERGLAKGRELRADEIEIEVMDDPERSPGSSNPARVSVMLRWLGEKRLRGSASRP